ncbi:MAG: hypothetical protein GYA62_08400, partial [Bacteroidales bacterium]|nr:hypothetical protein [Bacteroidales bacterium]
MAKKEKLQEIEEQEKNLSDLANYKNQSLLNEIAPEELPVQKAETLEQY